MQTQFTNNQTQIMKGIAILLMFCNHLYPITDWIYPENMYTGISIGGGYLAAYVGGFGKICVSIFAFFSGIGFYYGYKKGLFTGWKNATKRLMPLYLTFWLILFGIYIPLMIVSGVYTFDIKDLLLNMSGYRFNYCKVAWYLRFYLEITITFPIYAFILTHTEKLKKKYELLIHIVLMLGAVFLRASVYKVLSDDAKMLTWEYLNYLQVVLIGYYSARWKLLEWGKTLVEKCISKKFGQFILSGLMLGGIFVGRGLVKNISTFNMDVIYVYILVLFSWILVEILPDFIGKFLSYLGSYSTELWFLHAIFFIGNLIVQKVGYWPKVDILILVWVTILLLPIAVLTKKIITNIMKTR